jgi:hypothetical protein
MSQPVMPPGFAGSNPHPLGPPNPGPGLLSDDDIGAQVMAAAARLKKQLAEQGITPASGPGLSSGGGSTTVADAAAKLAEQQKKRAMLWKSKVCMRLETRD